MSETTIGNQPIVISFSGGFTGTVGGLPVTCTVSLSANGTVSIPPPTAAFNASVSVNCSGPGISLSCSGQARITYPPLCIFARARCSGTITTPLGSVSFTGSLYINLCAMPNNVNPTTSFTGMGAWQLEDVAPL